MKSKVIVSLIIASAVMIFTDNAGAAESQHPFQPFIKDFNLQTTYSADINMLMIGSPLSSGKIYQDGTKYRFETTIPILNIRTIAIQTTRDGNPTVYMLFPANRKYVIQQSEPDESSQPDEDIIITDLGTEEFNGENCTKKRIVIKGDEPSTIDILLSPRQKNMPVKMTTALTETSETSGGGNAPVVEMTFTNYVFSTPDASLFTIPAGYTEAATMEEAMLGGGLSGLLGALAAAGAAAENDKDAREPEETAEETTGEMTDAAREAAAKEAKDAVMDTPINQGRKAIRGLLGR